MGDERDANHSTVKNNLPSRPIKAEEIPDCVGRFSELILNVLSDSFYYDFEIIRNASLVALIVNTPRDLRIQ